MAKILSKKLPTIAVLLLLGIALLIGFFLINKEGFLGSKKKEINLPLEVRYTNIQDDQITISWLTQKPTKGIVYYGESSPPEIALTDSRDQQSGKTEERQTHYVNLKNLNPQKNYYFKIGDGEEKSISTGPKLTKIKEAKTISGKILNPDKSPAKGTIVYLSSANINSLSALTDNNGRFTIFINQARVKDLTEYASFDVDASILKFEAQNGDKKTSAVILTKNAFPAIPDLILDHQNYDFREENKAEQMPSSPSKSSLNSSIITIDNPTTDGEKINSQQPNFLGQGPPNKVITIQIQSPEPYSTSTTVDESGNWSLIPPFKLTPGEHSIQVTYLNELGKEETINRNFLVLAAGESELPAITSSPSAELVPSPSPILKSSPNSVARISIPATDEGVPITGISWPTTVFSLTGILLIVLAILA
ncbi:hypothetical protein COT75_02255 [Candidatus Beckwithbacteria bacterium CG10_big_fil_rev_8_21_14_0_10_34_10]|uniref:Fibronectin type-III domain-containing protein n=1 Tax=Candidatus Beckwithbacteria bacterium CG10_big_fil_rev_8_21_14_0_10_34_10 TaxID=1974495 RepID=A0A2H0W9G6_9BACT|nr:MAG: hypothetical protein COT75_02255 [Candidatus Beckwithbacteria bacterium CG10_big_fil_rev_8_21_14_0_10_34_10]